MRPSNPHGSLAQLLADIIDTLDIEASDVTFVDTPETLPDINVVYVPISPERLRVVLQQEGVEGKYMFLSFGSPEEVGTGGEIDRALLLNPRVSPFVIPVGTYGDLPEEPVLTLAVDKLLVARPGVDSACLLYTSPSPRDGLLSRMPSSA